MFQLQKSPTIYKYDISENVIYNPSFNEYFILGHSSDNTKILTHTQQLSPVFYLNHYHQGPQTAHADEGLNQEPNHI